MKKVILMMSVLLSCGLFYACSSDDGYNEGSGIPQDYYEDPSVTPEDLNLLQIQADEGDAETCELYKARCGSFGPTIKYPNYDDSVVYDVYALAFVARINKTSLFCDPVRPYTYLNIYIENKDYIDINSLKVGDTFNSSAIRLCVENYLRENNTSYNGIPEYRAQSGQIQVVSKKTGEDGKSYLRIRLLDLKIHGEWGDEWAYTFNATIDYEICDFSPEKPNMEELTTPTDEFVFFMLDAINKELQGQHVFFSEGPQEQECLIINSNAEYHDAYKGDLELSHLPTIDFQYCTLVLGRTYGENGGVSLGDFELIDNGDTYQLNMTLNNNVNPNYTYTPDHVNLYFWKIYPKMENKPVVFNRITQDVNIDPLGENSTYTKMRHRWLLDSYVDADGHLHSVSNDWGDENYSIEFKENGIMEGRIGANEFSGYYMLPFTFVRDGKFDNWPGELSYGVINMWDWTVTERGDDNPLSKVFTHIFDATQFKIWSFENKLHTMTLRISEREVFGFYYENYYSESYGH